MCDGLYNTVAKDVATVVWIDEVCRVLIRPTRGNR